ncbi:RDD family protein [Niallia taxi]|nr:RDD family protein [Niallia taxi]MDE5052324.1 RDD family protein [Niallia taxi]
MSMDITNTGVDSVHQHSDEPPKAFDLNHCAAFWMRLWAYLVDIIIITSINRRITYPVFRIFDLPTENTGLFSTINILTAHLFYLYYLLMTKYFKQTLGRMTFGLKVIPLKNEVLTWDTVIFRERIGRFISASIWRLCAVVAFQPKKQGLHDIFADTAVVHEKRRR